MKWKMRGSRNTINIIARQELAWNTFCCTAQITPGKWTPLLFAAPKGSGSDLGQIVARESLSHWPFTGLLAGTGNKVVFSAQIFLSAPIPPRNTEKVKNKADTVLPLPETHATSNNLHDLCLSPAFFLEAAAQTKDRLYQKKGKTTIKREDG